MSVTAEIVSQHLPLATGEIAGINPAYFLAAGAVASAGFYAKKIIPSWHHTINDGEVGVPLRGGKAVERKDVTQAELDQGASRYVILQPNWYFVPPFRTIQTVYITDQPCHIRTPLECIDARGSAFKMHAEANLTWHVSPDGDNPVKSITEVMHFKKDKKDTIENDTDEENRNTLKCRVGAIGRVALGQVLNGMSYEELIAANNSQPEEIQAKMITLTQAKLLRYGVILTEVELEPITRADTQVTADAIVRSARITSKALRRAAKMKAPTFDTAKALAITKQAETTALEENTVLQLHANGNSNGHSA